MARFILALSPLALAVIVLAGACTSDYGLQTPELETNRFGNLEIIISNQSFAVDAVDIHVRIDDQVAISDVFHVEGQHTFITYTFDVAPGPHGLQVESNVGSATLEAVFETSKSRRWATIMYWNYPDQTGGAGPTPPQFSLDESDEQPLFE